MVAAPNARSRTCRRGSDQAARQRRRDLRRPARHSRVDRDGRVPGAFHCPRGMLEFWLDPASKYHKPAFAADTKFVFFCAAGSRSALATQTAHAHGIKAGRSYRRRFWRLEGGRRTSRGTAGAGGRPVAAPDGSPAHPRQPQLFVVVAAAVARHDGRRNTIRRDGVADLHAGAREAIGEFSPSGKVPVLLDGDVRVWESLAIIEYVAEKFPSAGLWPQGAAERAHARAIANEMHGGFLPLRRNCPMNMRRPRGAIALAADVRANIERIAVIWSVCRSSHAAAGPFLFGPFCAADAMFAPVVSRFHTYRIGERQHRGARLYGGRHGAAGVVNLERRGRERIMGAAGIRNSRRDRLNATSRDFDIGEIAKKSPAYAGPGGVPTNEELSSLIPSMHPIQSVLKSLLRDRLPGTGYLTCPCRPRHRAPRLSCRRPYFEPCRPPSGPCLRLRA